MIRATFGLAMVLLAGVVAVWWTARNLDPMRVFEQIVPAQVRTVDLTGSGPFLRQHPETDAVAPTPRSDSPERPEGAPGAASPPARVALPPTPSTPPEKAARAPQGVEPPNAPDATQVAERAGAEPAASQPSHAVGSPDASVAPPHDPAHSAALIRRMLALYERTGVPE